MGKAKRNRNRRRDERPDRRSRVIELPEPVMEALREQQRAFREKFGREMGPDDPFLFDPDADEPQPVAKDKAEAVMVRAMHATGIDPAFIYAYKVTGLMVTEHNRDTLPDEHVLEWDAAVDEFRRGQVE